MPPSPTSARRRWRRLTGTRQGATGLAILTAALLLWPFAGWSWIPWLGGVVVLLLVAVLRLDRFLHGWAGHVAGLAVVAGLMLNTGPWDWALAASLGVLLAGLVQLPWWRLAAAGAVLCVLAGIGWGVDRYRAAQAAAAVEAQRSQENVTVLGERSPDRVLPALLEGIGQGDAVGVCGLLDAPARAVFVQAAAVADCPAAVARFHTVLSRVPPLRHLDAPLTPAVATVTVDGCRTEWAAAGLGGSALGLLDVAQSPPPGRSFFVIGFRPCPASRG
jgi:hypothetical protein